MAAGAHVIPDRCRPEANCSESLGKCGPALPALANPLGKVYDGSDGVATLVPQPRLLIADDHELFVEGLSKLLEREFDVVGTVPDGRQLVEQAATFAPDIILVDISMPHLNGIEAIRQLRQAKCRAKILVLTMHADPEFASQALAAGASGYVLKHCPPDEVRRALREVLIGRKYITPRIADALMEGTSGRVGKSAPSVQLTPREREVLQMIAEGLSLKEVAAALNLSPRTAEFHRYNMSAKLGLKTVAELTRYAIRHGLASD